jgi:hypothetical protein
MVTQFKQKQMLPKFSPGQRSRMNRLFFRMLPTSDTDSLVKETMHYCVPSFGIMCLYNEVALTAYGMTYFAQPHLP